MQLVPAHRSADVVRAKLVASLAAWIAIAALAGCGGQEQVLVPAPVEGQVTGLDAAQGAELIDRGGALVIDVRSLDEYTSGHLVGAQSIPFEDEELWLTRIDPLDRERPTVVYAATGDDSSVAAARLVEEGFRKVYDLGGVGDWDPEDLRVDA